jgi:hypothetical protein
MSWALGLSIWIVAGLGVAWLWGEIARRTDRTERDIDWVADHKRKLERNAHRARMGLK